MSTQEQIDQNIENQVQLIYDAIRSSPLWDRASYHMRESLARYAAFGDPVGGFLRALLANDLMEACSRADENNSLCIYEYAKVLYNHMPMSARGNSEKVAVWQETGGLRGYLQAGATA